MALEGLAALGLAGNIIQLIDFSYKLVSGAREISNSANGVSAQHETFETVSQSLVELVNNLDRTSSSQIPPKTRELAAKTKSLAQSFIAKLNELKPKGPKRPWSGFIQAMKEANQSDKLLALNKKLNTLHNSLNTHLLEMMRQQLMEVNEMVSEGRRLHLQTTLEVQQLQNKIIEELEKLKSEGRFSDSRVAEHLKSLEDPMVLGIEKTRNAKAKQEESRRIAQRDVELLSNIFVSLSNKIKLFPTAANMAWPQYSLLKSLWYQGMRDRQQTVPSAHSKTLNWIFDGSVPESYRGPKPGFVEWLEHEDGIFWVHGKPGSGKSTLMKFFASHQTTRRLLERWAKHGKKRPVIASHFFWIAGGKLQRSQKGLLRTLLFNILHDCPDLVPCVYPDQKAIHYPTDYEEWTFQELNEAFSKLKSQKEVRICLFIDGLDEYDPDTHEGSYEDLIKTLVGISESPDIKICISSRSWYVFKDAFNKGEERSKWVVTLEDLNRPDIEAYVHSSFSDNERFRDLSNRDPRYPALLEQVVQKSQGVFLWVFLVVRSLLQGLTFADRVSDLQRRLDQIPDDLNDYFEQILGSVDEFYLKETAKIFQIMLKSKEALPLLVFSFLFEEDHDYAFKIPGRRPMESSEITRRCDETRRRLDGRCKGLVEADVRSLEEDVESLEEDVEPLKAHVEPFQADVELLEADVEPLEATHYSRVRFLHRTVPDFLENKAMEKLFRRLDTNFDVDVSVARSYLALIKTCPARSQEKGDEDIYHSLLFHCRSYEVRKNEALVDVLDEFRAIEKFLPIRTAPFLEFVAQDQLWLYLLWVVETGSGIDEDDRVRLLYWALSTWMDRGHVGREVSRFNKDFIICLLRKGTSPNRLVPSTVTQDSGFQVIPWDFFLNVFRSNRDISTAVYKNEVFEITKCFIAHGALCRISFEGKLIHEADHVLPIEQRRELVKLLKARRRLFLIKLTISHTLSVALKKLRRVPKNLRRVSSQLL